MRPKVRTGQECRHSIAENRRCRRKANWRGHRDHEEGCKVPPEHHHAFVEPSRSYNRVRLVHVSVRIPEDDRDWLLEHGGISEGIHTLVAIARGTERRAALPIEPRTPTITLAEDEEFVV